MIAERTVPPHLASSPADVKPSPLDMRKALLQEGTPILRLSTVLAKPTHTHKIPPPPLFKGTFYFHEREAWISQFIGYMRYNDVEMDNELDTDLTPAALFLITSLCSAEPSASSPVAPLRCFTAHNQRAPFKSSREFILALRDYWSDPTAADRALEAFRKCQQGPHTAREFGALVDALANECIGRTFDDADRKEQFMAGLTHEYSDFARQTLALKGIPWGTGTLEYKELTDLVAVKDALRVKTASAAPSSSSSRKGNTDRSSPSLAPSPSSYPSSKSPSPPSTKPPSDWLDRAVAFQSKNPEATKASWHRPSSTPSPKNMWCYNCTKYDSHFSTACLNARRDPKKVVLAAFGSLSLGASSSSSLSSSASDTSRIPELDDGADALHASPAQGKANGV